MRDVDEPLGLGKGQRPEQDRVDDAEHRGRRTEPEGENDEAGDRERGGAAQTAAGVQKLAREVGHRSP